MILSIPARRLLPLLAPALVLSLAACGMKGPLQQPPAPPADPDLVEPPTIQAPAPTAGAQPTP